jgi:hypothetical protein
VSGLSKHPQSHLWLPPATDLRPVSFHGAIDNAAQWLFLKLHSSALQGLLFGNKTNSVFWPFMARYIIVLVIAAGVILNLCCTDTM